MLSMEALTYVLDFEKKLTMIFLPQLGGTDAFLLFVWSACHLERGSVWLHWPHGRVSPPRVENIDLGEVGRFAVFQVWRRFNFG